MLTGFHNNPRLMLSHSLTPSLGRAANFWGRSTDQAQPQPLTPTIRTPHPKQSEFIETQAKRKVIRAGRRGGKTTGIAILALQAFCAGRRVLYGVPTQDQADTFWYEVKQALRADIEAKRLIKNETRRLIERPGTRQRIRCKTA